MATFKKFEDMEVWKRACKLAVDIYKLTNQSELQKDWGLRDQIRRSAISISSNIAEGFERNSNTEFKRFLLISKGSCGELRSQLYILKALSLLPKQEVGIMIDECAEISSMIQSLIHHIKSSIKA
jgi:four helix bundle protein